MDSDIPQLYDYYTITPISSSDTLVGLTIMVVQNVAMLWNITVQYTSLLMLFVSQWFCLCIVISNKSLIVFVDLDSQYIYPAIFTITTFHSRSILAPWITFAKLIIIIVSFTHVSIYLYFYPEHLLHRFLLLYEYIQWKQTTCTNAVKYQESVNITSYNDHAPCKYVCTNSSEEH